MSDFIYSKQPWEEEIIGVDFVRRIPSGVTVLPVDDPLSPPLEPTTYAVVEETVSLTNSSTTVNSDPLQISNTTLLSVAGKNRILTCMVSNGNSGFKYRVSFKITLSDGQRKEDDIWVIVREV